MRFDPLDMTRPAPVTGFTTDVDLEVFRRILLRRAIVVLLHRRGVTVGARIIPVVARSRPVKWIPGLDVLVGLKVKPALPTLAFGPGIPSEGKRLQAPGLHLDQILLQGLDTESVDDREPRELPVRAKSLDHESGAVAKEPRGLPVVARLRIVEIAEHRLFGGPLHGEIVMRPEPLPVLCFVTSGASPRADVLE